MLIRKNLNWQDISLGPNLEYKIVIKTPKQRLLKRKEIIKRIKSPRREIDGYPINVIEATVNKLGIKLSTRNKAWFISRIHCIEEKLFIDKKIVIKGKIGQSAIKSWRN